MEHLPKSSYQFSHLAIPVLAGPKYDDQGFEGFPSRLGYDVQKIMRGDFSGHSVLDIEAFSQSWLFFALMSQVLDCFVNENDFIREEEDVKGNFRNKGPRKVINTGTYITLRDKRREHEKSWLFDKKHTWYNDSYSALALATEYLSQLAINAHRGIALMPLRPEIELWLSVMVSTMKFETAHMFSVGIPTKPLVDEGGVATNHLVMDLLRADGWCESHIRMLASSMDAAAVYYICTLGPPKIKKDHGKCSTEKCEADQIVDSEYVTRHRTDGCQCEYLGPDPEQVREILDNGSFPCIKVTCNRATTDGAVDKLPNLTVGVVPFHQDQNPIHYVALSHVWSGGLGNPIANALPRCQLLWLYDQVAAMPETRSNEDDNSVYFWMDTLCVPLYPESARQRAIRSMRDIYNESHAVLVLDSELLLSTANCTNEERLMRVSNSSWMRRLWTYQEAILAKSIFFLFLERAVSIEELWAPLFHGSIYDRFSNGISIQGSRFYQTLRWVSRYNAPTRFLSLLDALQWRQTSKMRDECVCVAALFGYDTDKIFGVPDRDKLKKLLELQGTFIKGFPFLSGPKMVEDGYRWAPGALMRRRGSEVLDMVGRSHTQDVYARWTPDGLWGEWYGFVLSTDCNQMRRLAGGGKSPQSFLVACSRNSRRYAVTRAFEPNPEDEPDWDQVGLHRLENPAIVLETDVDSIVGKHFPSLGILVDIRRKNQGIWFARYQCRVMVREYLVDDTSDGDEAGEVSSNVYPVTERTEGKEHQYHGYPWCIM